MHLLRVFFLGWALWLTQGCQSWGNFWFLNFTVDLSSIGGSNYSLSNAIYADFNIAADLGSLTANTTVGSTACTGAVQVSKDNFQTCISLKAMSLLNDGKRLAIYPTPAYLPNTTYQLKITTAAKSYQGGALSSDAVSSTYTTKDAGKWVFVAGFSGSIFYCTLNQTTGVLGAVNSVTAVGQTQFLALEPTGKFVFAHPNNSSSLYYASINQTTGVPAATASVTNAANAGLAYHPTLPILYTTIASQIKPFSINTVSGLPTAGSALSAGTASNIGITIHPTAKFLYWGTSGGGNNVYSAQIATDGSLSAPTATPATGANNSHHPVIDPGGNFLYATDYGGAGGVYYFSINQDTGALTLLGNVGVPTPGQSTTIDPTGRFLYNIGTANPTSTISVFSLNASTGVPTLVQAQTGLNSYATFMAIDPSGRFAVVGYGASGATGDKIISFSIDQQTGVLTQISVLTASNAQSVAIY